MNKNILQLGAMIALGIGVILIVVSVRDVWRSSATIAHASNDASHLVNHLVAVPTAIAPWPTAQIDLPVTRDPVVEVK